MTTAQKQPVLVVLQLNGGNDYLNTVVPRDNPAYFDNRRTLGVPEDKVLGIDDEIGLNPVMAPLKEFYDRGDMAIIHGVGWEGSNRSHFRCMDIWHTIDIETIGDKGWLGMAVSEIDHNGENPVKAVNVGQGLPRALVAPGVSAASVSDLNAYGLLTSVEQQQERDLMLQRFANMYAPAIGTGPVVDYLKQTGRDALKGADMLRSAPAGYASSVEYGSTTLAGKLRDVAMVHVADLGTQVFYLEHTGYDTHAAQATTHPKLWTEVSTSVADFFDDLREQEADHNVVMFIFSEFGRRVRENGTGTDHGAAGVAFAIGKRVNGGTYSTYPELRPEALNDGDLVPTQDFRGVYTTILEDWLEVDAVPIVKGTFEAPRFIQKNGG